MESIESDIDSYMAEEGLPSREAAIMKLAALGLTVATSRKQRDLATSRAFDNGIRFGAWLVQDYGNRIVGELGDPLKPPSRELANGRTISLVTGTG